MPTSHKESVELGLICAGPNPRRDFGDIAALAATIEATGGQPVNPIVVVADGNRYRIVDGERRYRAMLRIHGASDLCDVIVFDDYSEAQEAVAMLATDDKMTLSDAERATGFQQMMVLGVESRTIARAMRRKTSEVAAARAVAKEAPPQATLDQMIAAAEFEDEEDREAVLAAEPDKWEAKAKDIRREREVERQREELLACIEGLGFDPEEHRERPKGYASIATCYTAQELERYVEERDGEELAVWPCVWNDRYWMLGHKVEEREESPEERERHERVERIRKAFSDLRLHLMREVAECDVFPEAQALAGRLRADGDDDYLLNALREAGVADKVVQGHLREPASMWETLATMAEMPYGWAEWTCAWLPLLASEDGAYAPTEDEKWLWEQAKTSLAEEGQE